MLCTKYWTQARKPLSFAEVEMTFDNSDNVLNIEFQEVTIKRKIYDDKDWYEEYIQVLKDGKEIHYGESFDLPKYENGNYIFYLNLK